MYLIQIVCVDYDEVDSYHCFAEVTNNKFLLLSLQDPECSKGFEMPSGQGGKNGICLSLSAIHYFVEMEYGEPAYAGTPWLPGDSPTVSSEEGPLLRSCLGKFLPVADIHIFSNFLFNKP
jgi:hypothetical protein